MIGSGYLAELVGTALLILLVGAVLAAIVHIWLAGVTLKQ